MYFPQHILHDIALVLLYVKFVTAHFEHKDHPKLLLLSFDGFRWDYLHRVGPSKAPNFFSLINDGVRAKWVVDAFITKTFPNHLTIVSGLWEESHGFVDNVMFDPKFNRTFNMKSIDDEKNPMWWDNGAVPIWIANEQEDEKRKSGTIFWPGCQSTYSFHGKHGLRQRFDFGDYRIVPYQTLVDKMVEWFSQKDNPINFGALYINNPDHLAHQLGPDSPEIDKMIQHLDKNVTGYLIQKLKEHDLFEKVNIILTSDHGFTEITRSKVIEVNNFKIDPNLYTYVGGYTLWNIIPKPGHEDEVYNGFKKIPHLSVYKKKDIPPELHYSKNRRILQIVVLADEGYTIVQKGYPWDLRNRTKAGGHGYNNSLESMHPFFIAHGPAFKRGYERGPLSIVDIYPLMGKVLGLEADDLGPNNGSLSRVMDMLKPAHHTFDMRHTFITFILVIVGASLITGIYSIVVVRQQRVRSTRRFRLLTDGIINESTQPMMLQSDEEL